MIEVSSPSGHDVLKCKYTLEDVLVFVTGAPAKPPLGFMPRPTIKFWNDQFPKANTCTNTLYLPLSKVPLDVFKYNMLYGFLNSLGFGRV